MGFFDNIGKSFGRERAAAGAKPASEPAAARTRARTASKKPSDTTALTAPSRKTAATTKPSRSKLPGKRKKRGAASPRERIASTAAPLHDRRKRLVGARETTLRDLGGLMLEMYKRNRFREELLLDKCEEILAIEVEIAHVDQRLFQLAPPNAAGMRPIGRCECGSPIHPGQNFCGVCGRSFATLTQARSCERCGAGLRPGDQFCASCGTDAPDVLQALPAPGGAMPGRSGGSTASTLATSAVAQTVVIDTTPPPIDEPVASMQAAPTPAAAMASAEVFEAPTGISPLVSIDDLPATVSPPTAIDEMPAPASSRAGVEQPSSTGTLAPDAAPSGFQWSAPANAPDAAIDAAIASLPSVPQLNPEPATPAVIEPFPTTPATPSGSDEQPAAASTDSVSPSDARRAQKLEARRQAKNSKERAQQAKARAKAKAKAARTARKRGNSGD